MRDCHSETMFLELATQICLLKCIATSPSEVVMKFSTGVANMAENFFFKIASVRHLGLLKFWFWSYDQKTDHPRNRCSHQCQISRQSAASFLTRALASLRNMSFAANCFRRTEVNLSTNNDTLARVWRQRCSCCHNCSEHNYRNCPVSGKITPTEVAVRSGTGSTILIGSGRSGLGWRFLCLDPLVDPVIGRTKSWFLLRAVISMTHDHIIVRGKN